jgi:hypothetical protein
VRKAADLLRQGFALGNGDLDVAAQDGLAALRKTGHDRRGERPHARERRDAEEQANDEEAQPGEPAAQVAQRQTKCEAHTNPPLPLQGRGTTQRVVEGRERSEPLRP